MPCLQKLLVGLILFSPTIYALATPDQADAGKVRGFTGPADVKPNGDYLTATFCYCAYPEKVEEVMGPAHLYQFEYYNKHHDTTFVLLSSCPDGDIGFDKTCVPANPPDEHHLLSGNTMDMTCKQWEGYEDYKDKWYEREDELCYMPQHKHGDDYISFNGQSRNLGSNGGQGAVFNRKWEPEICEGLCQEYLDMSMLKDKKYPLSHQVEWTRLDDMCEECE